MFRTLVINNPVELLGYGISVSHHEVFHDDRGYLRVAFTGNFNTNETVTRKSSKTLSGYFRGMHIQIAPSRQEKITCVIDGKIMQVFIDLDKKSKFFGLTLLVNICASDNITLRIPSTFAHGFYAYEDTIFDYISIGKYDPHREIAINPKEILLHQGLDFKLSKKDESGITLTDIKNAICSSEILI